MYGQATLARNMRQHAAQLRKQADDERMLAQRCNARQDYRGAKEHFEQESFYRRQALDTGKYANEVEALGKPKVKFAESIARDSVGARSYGSIHGLALISR